MTQQPFFSIVMPAYNCENTIGDTIKSIQSQQFENYELIIVNDGSTDGTEEVVNDFAKEDSRITILTIANNGPGNARNKGISIAIGKYLYLMDSDDTLPQETLIVYFKVLDRREPDLIVSSYQLNVLDKEETVDTRIVFAGNNWISSNEEFLTNLFPLMEKQLMYVIWNKVYRMDIIKNFNIEFPPYSSCEDRLFNIRYYKHVNTCQLVNDILYHYSFEGKKSLTNRFLINKFETFEEFYIEALNLTQKNKEGVSALFLKGTMSCIIPLHSKDCPYSFKEKLSEINRILNNKTVIQATELSIRNTLMRKVMAWLFQSKSVGINYIASYGMYLTSLISPRLIEKLKSMF